MNIPGLCQCWQFVIFWGAIRSKCSDVAQFGEGDPRVLCALCRVFFVYPIRTKTEDYFFLHGRIFCACLIKKLFIFTLSK